MNWLKNYVLNVRLDLCQHPANLGSNKYLVDFEKT